MKRIRILSLTAVAALAVAACGGGASPAASAPASAAANVKILVDMKGPGGGNPFWAAVQKGAQEAGKANNVQVDVQAPPTESDVPSQIAQIEDAITKGYTGIALAPTDPAALKPVVQKAIDKGIKVVFIDTKGENEGVTFIGTNNEAGAKLAADEGDALVLALRIDEDDLDALVD